MMVFRLLSGLTQFPAKKTSLSLFLSPLFLSPLANGGFDASAYEGLTKNRKRRLPAD